MKRIAVLFAAAVIGATALPAAAEAQGRGRAGANCSSGDCRSQRDEAPDTRDRDRGGRDDRGGGRGKGGGNRGSRDDGDRPSAQRSRPPGRGDDDSDRRTQRPGQGGNSLGDNWNPRAGEAREGVRGGRLVPLQSVIRNISRSNPGQLLDAGLEERGGRQVYRVRWQTNDGRRVDYIVDATTGQIIGRN